ncbi:hypothetical protein OOZ54_05705 [Rhodopseudomonas palustris]|uniref:hypothetical protein n=1 Tax=Rhodopseudomonas palustris TaxID=1076 RepID=UPI001FD94344|nr:hypothetical protein [Rhodopseudomonas palustris]WBU32424.1 hypothetical protein OOZ54_05705 [Rhodopseudomonas palustris]
MTNPMTAPAIAGPNAPTIIGAGFMNNESTKPARIAGDVCSEFRFWLASCIKRKRVLSDPL